MRKSPRSFNADLRHLSRVSIASRLAHSFGLEKVCEQTHSQPHVTFRYVSHNRRSYQTGLPVHCPEARENLSSPLTLEVLMVALVPLASAVDFPSLLLPLQLVLTPSLFLSISSPHFSPLARPFILAGLRVPVVFICWLCSCPSSSSAAGSALQISQAWSNHPTIFHRGPPRTPRALSKHSSNLLVIRSALPFPLEFLCTCFAAFSVR